MNVYTKINALLTPAERRSAWALLVLMVVGMLLEMLGVGLIIPVISLMMQSDAVAKYPAITSYINITPPPTQAQIVTFVMLGLVGIFLLKNLFLGVLSWRQIRFSFDVLARLSQRLFEIYLRQPYTFHLQRNSAQLVNNVIGEVGIFYGVIASALLLYTELLVLFGIGVLLILVEPLGALIVAVAIGSASWGFHYLMHERITRWGAERQLHDGLKLQHVQQGLGGAKDVKLLGREKDFLAQYHTHNINSARAWKLQYTFQSFPRLMFEILAVTGLAILVLSMLSKGRDMASIVPVLGLFAAAAFRLTPSVSRVLNSMQSLRYNLAVVNRLYEEIQLESPEPMVQQADSARVFRDTLSLENVTYYYPAATQPALNGITINIRKGESIGLIGTSGSGKSTLVDVILGLLTPDGGSVVVDGKDANISLRQWQNQIGYVPQSIYLTDDTLRRNVAFGLADEQIDQSAVEAAIKMAQLDEFVASLKDRLETVVGERGIRLSGGQRQRIGIARALYHNPEVLVLDEATSALDSGTERGVMEAVGLLKGRKTIIIVAHRLSTVESCDRLYRLEHGRVVNEGPPEYILSTYEDELQVTHEIETK